MASYYLAIICVHLLVVPAISAKTECASFSKVKTRAYYSARNRALLHSVYARFTLASAVMCGRECAIDSDTCLSFNFYREGRRCELSNGTRENRTLGNLCRVLGSAYYDASEDTARLSVSDADFIGRRSCQTLLMRGGNEASGIYTVYPDGEGGGADNPGIRVYCDMELDGGGWTVFQRRQDGSVDFFRNWADYRAGFGDLSGEFWLGNDNLVALTSDDSRRTWELRVDLEDWEGNTAWAKYEDFKITGDLYKLSLGDYNNQSTAGDSLVYLRDFAFSTKDRDNDGNPDFDCATDRVAGWWYNRCSFAQLNGEYRNNNCCFRGIVWSTWKGGAYSIKKTTMAFREVSFC